MSTQTHNQAHAGGRVKLTKAQLELLQLALRQPTGNPWPAISMSRRGGGALRRMFERMQARGWFDASNCLTAEGRAVAAGDRP